jgi:hypothetical protein
MIDIVETHITGKRIVRDEDCSIIHVVNSQHTNLGYKSSATYSKEGVFFK